MVGVTNKKKPRGKGKPFAKGFDARRHLSGPPAKAAELKSMVQRLFEEKIQVDIGGKKTEQTQLEFMLRMWILSNDGFKQSRALEYGYGKVAEEINVNTFDVERFIKDNISIFTDGQLTRIANGEDPLVILVEVIQETQKVLRKTKNK